MKHIRSLSGSQKNIWILVSLIMVVLWLLYSLAITLHETNKIRSELAVIEKQNEKYSAAIEEQEKLLQYLNTTERITKEAKTQMGRKEAGEQVIVFIDDTLGITQGQQRFTQGAVPLKNNIKNLSVSEKWAYRFFGQQ